jgi:GNAT superfamily N-acetyltransferase
MQISFLADHPEFIETLAPWIYEHWRPILTQETVESRIVKLRAHLSYNALPIAWVAHSGSQVFGTAALRVHDLPGKEHLTPWLGGVYVAPKFRGQGIGAALCSAVEQQAKSVHGISMLYLFTLDKQAWYTSLGWSMYESCTWCGRAGNIMYKVLGDQR